MRYTLTTLCLIISTILSASHLSQASDSLLNVLKTTRSPKEKVQIYRNLADIHSDTPSKKTYLLKMYKEASDINDKQNMLNALNDIVFEETVNYNKDSVVKYIDYIKEIATPEETRYLLSLYKMRIFESQSFSDEKEEAIQKELSFLNSKTNKTNDIYKEIASTYCVGVSFYTNEQFGKALPLVEKALKMAETLPNEIKQKYMKRIIWKLCFIYAHTDKHSEAVKMMEKLIYTVEMEYKTDYQRQRPFYKIDLYLLPYYSFMISSLANLTLEQEKYYWKRIQEIGKNLTNTLDKYSYYLGANNYYLNNRTKVDIPKAIAANDSLIKFAETIAPQNLSGLYDITSQIYEQEEDYQNALKYLKISRHYQDSLTSEHAQNQLNELQVKYDINTLNSEKSKLEIENKQMMVLSLSILLLIVIGICSYLFYSLKKEKRMKVQLNYLHLKAQESEKMKQTFINSICHEIRTPLNAIVGFSDLIMNEDIDAEMRKEFPSEIQKNTALLTNLINSMLEVANLDVSEEKLPCKSTDLRNICIQEMNRVETKTGIEYKLDITEENTYILTNGQYLTQVIEHLLNNANKFTEKGSITLGYKIDEKQGKVCISITDTGCGIPKEKYEEVFNRFAKLDTFIPGNGLGLYLCQLIVKRLAGEIYIDPEYTKGTKMVVIVPIE